MIGHREIKKTECRIGDLFCILSECRIDAFRQSGKTLDKLERAKRLLLEKKSKIM